MPAVPEPDVVARWWATSLRPWWRDFDNLGHVTAASYAVIYEEAFGRFAIESWGTTEPHYVVARTEIDYLREIRRPETPVTVHIGLMHLGRSSVTALLVLRGPDGSVRSTSRNRYVAWDPGARGRRELLPEERAALRPHLVDVPGTS